MNRRIEIQYKGTNLSYTENNRIYISPIYGQGVGLNELTAAALQIYSLYKQKRVFMNQPTAYYYYEFLPGFYYKVN